MRPRLISLPILLLFTAIRVVMATPQTAGPIENIVCPQKGRCTILYLVPDGKSVTKGQLVCLLNGTGSRENIEFQHLRMRSAETASQEATLSREAAEIVAKSVEEGTLKQQLETIQSEINLAESELTEAEHRMDWTRRMIEKRYLSPAQMTYAILHVQKARTSLERLTRKRTMVQTSSGKPPKDLRANLDKARAEELFFRSVYEFEKAREDDLWRKPRTLQIVAQIDGSVRHARTTSQVEEGAEISEGQLLLRIIPNSKGTPAKP
jgi:HlyD family secretion protein